MEDSRFIITSKQLIFIIVGSQIATGIFSLPRIVTADAGVHGWLSLIIGAVPAFITIFLVVALGNKYPDKNFVEISKHIFGKTIGSILVIIFIFYTLVIQSIVVRIFAEVTSLYMLPRTPLPVIIFLVLLPVIYIIIKGGKVVGRMNEVLFYLLLFALIILLLNFSQADLTNILPINKIDFTGLLKGALSSSFSYAGVEVLLVVFFMVRQKNEVLKAALTGQLIVLIIYLFVVVIGILVFGIYVLQERLWPTLTLLKTVDIPFLGRLEVIFLAFWVALGIRPVMNLGLAAVYSTFKLFSLNVDSYKWVAFLMAIGIYIGAMLPHDVLQAMEWSTYVGYAYLVVSLGYPLIYNFVGLFRKGNYEN